MADSPHIHGGGDRLVWEEAPPALRSGIEALTGSTVRTAVSSPGGFSPAMASTLALDDGRKVFVKAVSAQTTDIAVSLLLREERVVRALPDAVPHARILAEGTVDGWRVLISEHIDGRHPDPGRAADRDQMLAFYADLARELDPSPIPLERFDERVGTDLDAWEGVARGSEVARIVPWIDDHLPEVAAAAAGWRAATRGGALVHGDLRADNMLLTATGPVALDWPEACIGAPWLDLALGLPSIALFDGAPSIVDLSAHPLLRSAGDVRLTALVAALTGYFLRRSTDPPIPGLPTLRTFQREQGLRAAVWLRHLLETSR